METQLQEQHLQYSQLLSFVPQHVLLAPRAIKVLCLHKFKEFFLPTLIRAGNPGKVFSSEGQKKFIAGGKSHCGVAC